MSPLFEDMRTAERQEDRSHAGTWERVFLRASPVRIIEQLLQPITERRRKAGGPGRIDQADTDHRIRDSRRIERRVALRSRA